MTYPKITKGLGKLTPELWIRLMDMLRNYEQAGARALRKPETENQYREYFLAELTGCALITATNNRWEYSFEEVNVSGTTFTAVTGGQSGTVAASTAAYNACEAGNTSTEVGTGVYMAGDYPSGFNMMPIGMTADNFDPAVTTYASLDVDVSVMMYNTRAASGALTRVFFAANSHDGACT